MKTEKIAVSLPAHLVAHARHKVEAGRALRVGRPGTGPGVSGVTLDAGALITVERGDLFMQALHASIHGRP